MAVDFADTISVFVTEFGTQLIEMKETPCRSIQSLFNSADIETLNKRQSPLCSIVVFSDDLPTRDVFSFHPLQCPHPDQGEGKGFPTHQEQYIS